MIKDILSFWLNNSSVCFLNAKYRNNLYLVSWIQTLNKHPGFRFIRTFEEKILKIKQYPKYVGYIKIGAMI